MRKYKKTHLPKQHVKYVIGFSYLIEKNISKKDYKICIERGKLIDSKYVPKYETEIEKIFKKNKYFRSFIKKHNYEPSQVKMLVNGICLAMYWYHPKTKKRKSDYFWCIRTNPYQTSRKVSEIKKIEL